jgi:hypothetical protein
MISPFFRNDTVEIVVPNNKFRQCVPVEKSKKSTRALPTIPFDRPGRRKAAISWHGPIMSQKLPLASRNAVAGIGYALRVSDDASSSTPTGPSRSNARLGPLCDRPSLRQARHPLGCRTSRWRSPRQRPQSSSASRFTAGAAGFLTLSQCGERPER